MKFVVLGLGSRGGIYSDILMNKEENCEIVAVCDYKENKQREAIEKYGVKPENVFSNSEELFAKGKIADALILASMDKDHYQQALKALELGYDLLLEKPMSPNEQECREIIATAEKYGRKIAVCHVLRYAPFYSVLKGIIDSGEIGEVVTVSQTESVGYWHQAHSFVRGNWRNSDETSPMILQKCCHDFDILRWLVGSPCKKVSSFGSLTHFKKENMPDGAASRCIDCTIKDCIYNAVDFYKTHPEWFEFISNGETDVEKGMTYLPAGRCVYQCDNNVVDHQVVNMQFENGATAQLTMTAFSEYMKREIHVHGTKGEIIGDMGREILDIYVFKNGYRRVDIKEMGVELTGHGGGDILLVKEFVDYIKGGDKIRTSAKVSLESHLMAFAAEKSRLSGGLPVEIEL